MARLEELRVGAHVLGLDPSGAATVKSVQFIGDQAVEVLFLDMHGVPQQCVLFREAESRLRIIDQGRAWSFDGDGELLRLASEAQRISLAWLFDPYVAITTSIIEPLPHQISAVYEEMLPRQPLRFLLADDPGAGKTIMAGLLVRELMLRGDLERCLIVAPGSLTEQWQDELHDKFGLDFELLTRDLINAARTANPFEQKHLLIARLDQLSRNDDLQERLRAAPEWDLIICDEAHRMSGHVQGGEVKYTKRYRLGQRLGERCRNFLLMTATPHNGNEEDFHIFLALLDGDRFEGRLRDGSHTSDASDLMRRLVKEDLLRFDGRKLFPERRSYTLQYELSPLEAQLYSEVTEYVREEMNRADRFADGENQRRVTVGFALMTLQRRLASSPEAILRSIERRRTRLESRLREERLVLRGRSERDTFLADLGPRMDQEDLDELYEEAPQEEREAVEEKVTDNATAARTIAELEVEIALLRDLAALAQKVHRSAEDTKWTELNKILDDPLMRNEAGHRRKLVIFTEFRDTLGYLVRRIRVRLGRPEAVVEIHGGVTREERRKVVDAFMNDPEVLVLVANDAAGEGVNLQRAHLMVNYDLPWNPNRLEQRFGRIHRIGQTEVCHLWNLVAKDTREGDVYIRLLCKIEAEREALGGKVFDVLGQIFDQKPLRELLVEAIRYGNDPEVRARLNRVVDGAVNTEHLRQLLDRRALVHDTMDLTKVFAIREDMERAHARRLQPHFIQAFFLDAFQRLGGKIHPREEGRFEITHVPAAVRERDRQIGGGAPVLKRYERVCFDKARLDEPPRAYLVCPGSPLLEAAIDLVLEQHSELLKRGAVLIDESDPGTEPRLLFYLEHVVQDGRRVRSSAFHVISQRMQFVEVGRDAAFRDAGAAPYLDYRAATPEERALLVPELEAPWLKQDLEQRVMAFAVGRLVPDHVEDVKRQRLPLLAKIEQQVKTRLQREINHWDRRAEDLKARERAGIKTRLPASVAQERAERLADRLQRRLLALEEERRIMPQPPRIRGGALIVPAGLLARIGAASAVAVPGAARDMVERLAMEAVLRSEQALGRQPRDVSTQRGIGHDIESRDPKTGTLYFIEVKGRAAGADTVTLSRNEILRALNVPDRFRLALVRVEEGRALAPVYVVGAGLDWGQPSFAQTSATYSLRTLLERGGEPC